MSAKEIRAYAIIELGLSLEDSGRLTIPLFKRLVKRQRIKNERLFNEQSALVRESTFWQMVPHMSEDTPIKEPSDIWLIEGEKPKVVIIPTREEQEKMAKKLGKTIILGE